MALIILRLRQLKEGAVLSESLQSQVRRSLFPSLSLALFLKGPSEIKVQKTNPGDHSGSQRRRKSWELGQALGVAGLRAAPIH